MSPTLLLLSALIGLLLGGVLIFLWLRLRLGQDYLSRGEVAEKYVDRTLHDHVQTAADVQQDELNDARRRETELTAELRGMRTQLTSANETLTRHRTEAAELRRQAQLEFERVANRLLEEKSERFGKQNVEHLGHLLNPLRERIELFEGQIERRFHAETQDRSSLREEIVQLRNLNRQLSADANNLAGALRGDSKTQGDWGEWQLAALLEASGLEADLHYQAQRSFRDEDGRQKRPDFIINLPGDKHLIIDSKVSLTAYDDWCRAETDRDTDHAGRRLRDHCLSLRNHVRDLAGKNYTELHGIRSPDFLLLFVPIEPALSLALRHERELFTESLRHNVVLVSPSTLLAMLRTVSYIWKEEKQKRNVQAIAKQSGLLYDQFVNFVADLQGIGDRLDQAQASYAAALNKLTTGAKPGATLVGRAQRLHALGAKSRKSLPKDLLDRTEEEE
ncbi:MAG: DNA recombination protein RmuC [Saprospiraceae bacterium]